MKHYFLNDQLIEAAEARIHASDLGLLRGYALFDFFRVTSGIPVFLADYLDRFRRSAGRLNIDLAVTDDTLTERIDTLLEANDAPESAVRLVLTGGYSADGFTPAASNLLILQHEAPSYSESLFQQGAHLMTHRYVRDIPDVKSTNYAMVLALLPQLEQLGAQDVLWHDGARIAESSRSNFFVVDRDRNLRTASNQVLYGITRKHVIDLAKEVMTVEEGEVPLDLLKGAQEAFVTSTTKGVMPVTRIDGKPIGAGAPGPITQQLARRFAAHVDAYVAARLDQAPA